MTPSCCLPNGHLCVSPLIYLISVQLSSQKERRGGKKGRCPTHQENWYVLSRNNYLNHFLYALLAFCGFSPTYYLAFFLCATGSTTFRPMLCFFYLFVLLSFFLPTGNLKKGNPILDVI
jgi:hypothetical protein